jgi:uncharacterized protein YeaO (DUF488 family)
MIRIRRVYEAHLPGEGSRYLVDRFWPRGIKKEALGLTAWLKDVAPSSDLCRWFAHDPDRWDEFQLRYFAELDRAPAAWGSLLAEARAGTMTLLFAARDAQQNNAAALKAFLENRLDG